jgi:hypothetical protein
MFATFEEYATTSMFGSLDSPHGAASRLAMAAMEGQPRWDYYERFFEALLDVIESSGVLSDDELAQVLVAREVASP